MLASKGKLKLSQTISGTQDSGEDASKIEKSFHGGNANGVQVKNLPKKLPKSIAVRPMGLKRLN